jgi:hypothetical protein
VTTEEEEQILARAYAAAERLATAEADARHRLTTGQIPAEEVPPTFIKTGNGWWWGNHNWVIPPEGDPAHLTDGEWWAWYHERTNEDTYRRRLLGILAARANRP